MSTLTSMIHLYGDIDCRDLGSRQLEQLREGLRSVSAGDISSVAEGKAFIHLLRKFREAVAENDKLHGDNYPNLLKSLLSVGEDGVYSNSLRFIFELIQNVDDCEFMDPADCQLDIRFRFNENEIVLSYNEVGFTPFNVFAITGIAEAAKNITASNNQIGEKGIGFKSVFGVANKVLIRSGWFSFELYKENFTIPIAKYASNEYYPGTQMTLYVPGCAKSIYNQIKSQYCKKDALFSKNPLLFLNKLTKLKMYFDSWRSMEFIISSKPSNHGNNIIRKDDVTISVNLHDYDNGSSIDVNETIRCARYTYPVVFTKAACQARYGEGTAVGGKHGKPMLLQAALPYPESTSNVGLGSLYSFLPTQLSFTVPLVCHVPFKLDASREFVDPQEMNLWFQESIQHMTTLMDYVFRDWSRVVGHAIIQYLPKFRASLFGANNGKENCLRTRSEFSGSHYLSMPLLKATDGEYYDCNSVLCFDEGEKIQEPERIYSLLELSKALFLPPSGTKPTEYGIQTEKNILRRLFDKAINVADVTKDAIDILDRAKYKYIESEIPTSSFSLSSTQLRIMLHHDKLGKIFRSIALNAIRKNERPCFCVSDVKLSPITEVLYSDFNTNEVPRAVENYLNFSEGMCGCLEIDENQFLPCKNGIILAANNPLSSFAAFCCSIDDSDTFSIRIRLKDASDRLNQCVEHNTGSAQDYLRDLMNIRKLVKDSLGEKGYKSYIELIQNAGTDKKRFLQEILQNADDCIYPDDAIPTFTLSAKGSDVITSYNETGFTRANIRSITAIGESTKNRLLDGRSDTRAIGEKGVGFKSLFAVASEVRIASGEFFFSLSDKEPTIPKAFKSKEGHVTGTKMTLHLKDMSVLPSLDEKSILSLVLCLRKLKKLDLNGLHVQIEDTNDSRCITINSKTYHFRKIAHSFVIQDQQALAERNNSSRAIPPEQEIVCYVPQRSYLSEYNLYNGLPTRHKMLIRLAIDAPFDLTTSRESINTANKHWNDLVREELYRAIIAVMHSLKETDKADILRFAKFTHRVQGTHRSYSNDISDCDYINSYPFADKLSEQPLLPTFDDLIFASAKHSVAFRVPEAIRIMLSMLQPDEFTTFSPAEVINVSSDKYSAVLGALNCKHASVDRLFP